jgi:hypothetical protein
MKITEQHEKILIYLVAIHSYCIGLMFFVFPEWTIQFAGWDRLDPPFFAHQAGAFHFALATAYLIEYHRYRGIGVMLAAKGIALVFLLLEAVFGSVPWMVPFAGVADGAMAGLVWWVHTIAQSGLRKAESGNA